VGLAGLEPRPACSPIPDPRLAVGEHASGWRVGFEHPLTLALERYGCTVSPPHSSGATSVNVSVKVHWCPNGSSALY
jgi:hypothetical protein